MTINPLRSLGVTRGFPWPCLLSAALVLLLASTAGAVDSCSLTGTYMVSATVDAPPGDQFLGTFTFTPPLTCTQTGSVSVAGSVMVLGQASPTIIPPTTAPYFVDAFGVLSISPMPGQAVMGQLGHLVGGVAQSIVFIAQPSDARFSGAAVRQDFQGSGATVVTGTPVTSAAAPNPGTLVGAAIATCPGVKVLLGGGALLTTSVPADAGRVALSNSFPQSATTWSATALVAPGAPVLAGTVTVTAFAICGNA